MDKHTKFKKKQIIDIRLVCASAIFNRKNIGRIEKHSGENQRNRGRKNICTCEIVL